MNESNDHLQARIARSCCILLILASAGTMTGRVLTVHSKSWRTPTPFKCANDISRWCTIRALVDHGTYAIDDTHRLEDERVVAKLGWKTIDLVRHQDRDGEEHFYSSKPPLLTTLLAGEYWVLKNGFRADIDKHTFYVARVILVFSNILPMLLYFALLLKILQRWSTTHWGQGFVMAAATFGTLLTATASTLNNHLPAAVSAMIAVYAAIRIWYDGRREIRYFVVAGAFAAFTAANELPALSFFALLGLALLWKAPWHTLLAGLPAALVVVAGFFGTNYVAHNDLAPPYAHRQEGDNWYEYPGSYWYGPKEGVDRGEPSIPVYAMHSTVGHHGILSLTPVWLLSLAGLAMMLGARQYDRRALAIMIIVLTLVCLGFYLMRPLQDRNYGGVSCGFRWMFWFTPLWLLAMIPAADAASRTPLGRGVALGLLLVSIVTAAFAAADPWAHPWIYRYWEYLGWL